MNSQAHDLVDTELHQAVSQVGLDVEYIRSRGNTMWARDRHGGEVPVTDFIGGYGSLILGHNHPEVVARARDLLDRDTPVHAQVSLRPEAAAVAAVLNRILQREFDTDEPYFAVFANSGAEAVEVAVKHAEMDRRMRLEELTAAIEEHIADARTALTEGSAVLAPAVLTAVGLPATAAPESALDALQARARTLGVQAPGPRLFTLAGGFHGKLLGSIQLTHNPQFRAPFTALGVQPRFLPVNQPEALRPALAAERTTVLDVTVGAGVVDVVERDVPVFCALLVEPVQGEGGIVPLTPEFAKELQAVCAEFDCPIVVDEIQTGAGRSGAFFASSLLQLRGDYYTLAKSLGGGLVKTSVTLVRGRRYRPQFELVHSSTFAKDAFSSGIALKVLDLLETDGGTAYRTAALRGARLVQALEAVRAEYDDIISDVRGLGLLVGIEFADRSGVGSPMVRQTQPAGLFGFLVSGYLLHEHLIRVMPTGSAPNTLRLEPSIGLTDDEIDRLATGLREVCEVLRANDDERLTAFLGARRF
ncbi:aminotransferase class III-fold pyridoxal phosphate-dependent enzyme [Streptomyces sp. CSDS2]|uniref:aspartate aminotransferase family protein n=1 Tax=Streptomyces sp. CSDS2 TaxID=3055051 RepID=UPI0025AF50D1|nr:aminotransferase class III-fold pyridoxal phosphate-dependent enzyme [Streptomyces sp. CSDS2]MDN3265298.1 aminotransferase class III-fold pyridoxal phosphate-dependent enzyme [Streptomyces sp. CSDS2]